MEYTDDDDEDDSRGCIQLHQLAKTNTKWMVTKRYRSVPNLLKIKTVQ